MSEIGRDEDHHHHHDGDVELVIDQDQIDDEHSEGSDDGKCGFS